MAWSFHAPSGTYRNFTLSNEIRREAIADAQFMKFLKPEPGFGKKHGDSMTITRILALPLAGRVGEMDQLPDGRPAIQTKTVSVSQWGFKIPLTELEEDLTKYNLPDAFKASLREQITLTMDSMAAAAFKLTPIKYTPLSTGYDFETDGSAANTSDRNLGIQDLRVLHDYMRSGNSGAAAPVPYFKGGKYVGILSTNAARGIKNDPEYKDWQAPTTSGPLMDGRLRDVEGFMLFESNHASALADLVGNSTTTGEAVFFGADAAGLLEVRAPEIRMSIPDPHDLGRSRWLGWVGTLEAFHTWETAALFRAIHVTST